VLRLALGTLHLGRIALLEIRARLGPDLFERRAEQALFERGALHCRQLGETGVGAIELVQLGGPHGEHRADFEHLHLDPIILWGCGL
jgi:hypothetical protein